MKKVLLLAIAGLFSLASYSQETSTIDAQRPTITESYSILDKGLLQFENGIDFNGIDSTFTYGSFVRGSVNDYTELRFFIDNNAQLTAGAKWLVLRPEVTQLGIGASFVFNHTFGANSDVRLALTKDFNKSGFVTYNFGYDGLPYNVILYGVPVVDKVNYFVEFMNYGLDNDGSYNRLHTGFTYIPHNDIQFDINGGISESIDNWYVGAGLSFRLR